MRRNSCRFFENIRRANSKSPLSRRAFTLVEILVVIVIIAILASAVVLKLANTPDEARVNRAQADINVFQTALEKWRLDMRRYPTEEEGLNALVLAPDSEDADLWKGPYVKLQKDPWGNQYVYIFPGIYNTNGFDLTCLGADGQEGGEELNADFGNWSEEGELYE